MWYDDVVSSCDDLHKYCTNVRSGSALLLINPCACSQYPANQAQ